MFEAKALHIFSVSRTTTRLIRSTIDDRQDKRRHPFNRVRRYWRKGVAVGAEKLSLDSLVSDRLERSEPFCDLSRIKNAKEGRMYI